MSRRLSYVLNILEIIMALIAKSVLSARIEQIRKAKEEFQLEVQDVLVSVAYQACRGNPNFANEMIGALAGSVRLKGVTMWLELHAPLRVKDGAFIINKGMAKQMAVKGEADFVEYEVEMRKILWWELNPAKKPRSMFEPDEYIDGAFERMVKNLNKEGCPDLANAIKALLPELYAGDAWKKMRDEPASPAVDADETKPKRVRPAVDADETKPKRVRTKADADETKPKRVRRTKAEPAPV